MPSTSTSTLSASWVRAKENRPVFTYRDTFLLLAELGVYSKDFAEQIGRSAGLRNILVHDYNDADRKIVHGSITSCLQDYHQYLEYVHRFLERLPA